MSVKLLDNERAGISLQGVSLSLLIKESKLARVVQSPPTCYMKLSFF